MRRRIVMILMLGAAFGCAGRVPGGASQAPPELPPPRVWSAVQLADLRAAAAVAPLHGLGIDREGLAQLDRLEPLSLRDAEMAQRLDTTANQMFESLAVAFAIGAVDPAQADPEWRIARAVAPDIEALRRKVTEGGGVADTLSTLLPNAPEYIALVAELARVQSEPDGAIDASGLSKLARVERLRANLERWRWLPRDLPARRIDVLVPFYDLRFRDDAVSTRHAVIVGARRTQTPSFTASVGAIVLNPTWTPPLSIVTGELLPRFRRDPNAAANEGFDVLDNAGAVVDPADVNWRARPFPYTLRQRAGAGNALGRLRFDLPNPYAIYLHDTPSRGLFARDDRALSHGCIRVAEPVTLAAHALADPVWDEAALNAAIATGITQSIALGAPLPIYVLYMTAAPDQDGVVRYADDVYGRDAVLLGALDSQSSAQRAALAAAATGCVRAD